MNTMAESLLARCDAVGIDLQPRGGRLICSGSDADLTPELRARLQRYEADLLRLLAGRPGPDGTPRGDSDAGGMADGPQHAPDGPEIDAGEWSEVIDPDGRRGWQRADLAALEAIPMPEICPTCAGLERWQDGTGRLRCPSCDPAHGCTARLQDLAQRLRERSGIPAAVSQNPSPAGFG